MIHSNIERIVEGYIGDDESCDTLKRHLGVIEREVDNLANKESEEEEPDINSVISRAMELIKRKSPFEFFEKNRSAIERDIRISLRTLEK